MELHVCHMYPDVLNLYGDRGNVLCMKKRLEWRGIGCTVTELPIGERRGLGNFDLFFVGGGQDFEQGLLLEDLNSGRAEEIKEGLARAGEDFDAVDGWAEAFVSGIGIFRLRQLCGWLWLSRKKVFEKSGFDMFDLVFGEGDGISGYKS